MVVHLSTTSTCSALFQMTENGIVCCVVHMGVYVGCSVFVHMTVHHMNTWRRFVPYCDASTWKHHLPNILQNDEDK